MATAVGSWTRSPGSCRSSDLFRTYEPQAPRSLGILRPLVVWEQGKRRFNLKSASVLEAEVNALVNAAMLKGNLIARGNFDSLLVPFRAVATDLSHREIVVLSSGDLAQAVRASAAIPLVFAPEWVDGRFLIDGGLSANIPVRIAREEGAQAVIVSDATEHPADSIDVDDPLIIADRLVGFLFDQPVDSLRDGRSPDSSGHRGVQEPQLRQAERRQHPRPRPPARPTRAWRDSTAHRARLAITPPHATPRSRDA